MKISIGFSRPKKKSWFSSLIMWVYSTPYSHVYIRLFSSKYQRDLIYQASGIAVNFMGPEVFDAHAEVVHEFEVDIPDDKYVALMQFAIDNAGKPYSLKAVLGLAWVRLNEVLGKSIRNPYNDGGASYVCCELAGYVLESFAGINIPKDMPEWTPKDIYDALVLNKNPI